MTAVDLGRSAGIITFIELMVAAGIGFAFYKLIVPPGPSKSASELGWKWFGWSLLLVAFSTVQIMAKKPSGSLSPMEFLTLGFGQLIANLFYTAGSRFSSDGYMDDSQNSSHQSQRQTIKLFCNPKLGQWTSGREACG
jgi:hypothetical protein